MTIRSAVWLGAKQVIAIGRLPERLSIARAGGAGRRVHRCRMPDRLEIRNFSASMRPS
jgi:threonine dehydrogenase-like Zn-dependent dehydrogenase